MTKSLTFIFAKISKYQLFLFILMLLTPEMALANVGIFEGFGHSVRSEKTAEVQMVSEEVDIYLLRAGGRVTGSLQYVDRAKFICRFTLRNLTSKPITIPVGFPLTGDVFASHDDHLNEIELISRFNFVAGTKIGSYPVRYVPFDREKKYGKIFTWSMEFKPNEAINLQVSYEMNGYAGLGNSSRDPKSGRINFKVHHLS